MKYGNFKPLYWLTLLFSLICVCIPVYATTAYYEIEIEIDNIWYSVCEEDTGELLYASVTGCPSPKDWSEYYKGYVMVPDTITLPDGRSCPVVSVYDYAFYLQTALDSVNLPTSVGISYFSFGDSSVKKLSFRKTSEELADAVLYYGCFAANRLEEVVMDSIRTLKLWNSLGSVKKQYVAHVDTIQIMDEYAFRMDILLLGDSVPPAVVGFDRWPTQRCDLTLLFVPDGCEERYASTEFWNTFYHIYPMSRAGEMDELFSKIEHPVGTSPEETEVTAVADGDGLLLSGLDGRRVRVFSPSGTEVYTSAGADSERVALARGIYIVACGSQRLKVAVR